MCNSASTVMLNADKPLQAVEGVQVQACVRAVTTSRKGIRILRAHRPSPHVPRVCVYVGIVNFLYQSRARACRADVQRQKARTTLAGRAHLSLGPAM